VQVPVVDAYLRERRRGVTRHPTRLGDLYFWNEPPAEVPGPSAPADSAVPRVAIEVEQASYQPMSGLLYAEGWAADASRAEPLQALALETRPNLLGLEYGRPRPDLARSCGSGSPCGFEYAAQITPEVASDLRHLRIVDLRAVMADGRVAHTRLSLPRIRILGDLSGPEWSDLYREVAEAATLGATDRNLSLPLSP
jgi:hypothetical protein